MKKFCSQIRLLTSAFFLLHVGHSLSLKPISIFILIRLMILCNWKMVPSISQEPISFP